MVKDCRIAVWTRSDGDEKTLLKSLMRIFKLKGPFRGVHKICMASYPQRPETFGLISSIETTNSGKPTVLNYGHLAMHLNTTTDPCQSPPTTTNPLKGRGG